jgi:hypothetical protein
MFCHPRALEEIVMKKSKHHCTVESCPMVEKAIEDDTAGGERRTKTERTADFYQSRNESHKDKVKATKGSTAAGCSQQLSLCTKLGRYKGAGFTLGPGFHT